MTFREQLRFSNRKKQANANLQTGILAVNQSFFTLNLS
jgi:hypothetical protein